MLSPNLDVPNTSSLAFGVVVPIPTLPFIIKLASPVKSKAEPILITLADERPINTSLTAAPEPSPYVPLE